MATDQSDSHQSSEESSNRLLKILIAVGIGIPVLIELLTLFNLINVQIFGNSDEEVDHKEEPIAEVQRFGEGDTLFADFTSPVLLDQMRARVSAQQWRFSLRLINLDSSHTAQTIKIDSMELQSGQLLDVQKKYEWDTTDGKPHIEDEWVIPAGDIPITMYISSIQLSRDTTAYIQQEVKFDNIPVRYNVDENN